MKFPVIFILSATIVAMIVIHNSSYLNNTELQDEKDIEIVHKSEAPDIIRNIHVPEVKKTVNPIILNGKYTLQNASSHSYLSSDSDSHFINEHSVWDIIQSDKHSGATHAVNLVQNKRCLQIDNDSYARMSEQNPQTEDRECWTISYNDALKAYTIHAEMNGKRYYLSNEYKLRKNLHYKSNAPIPKMFWYIHPYEEETSEDNTSDEEDEHIEVHNDSDSYDEM